MISQLRPHTSIAGSNFDKASDKDKRADFSKLGLTGYSGDKVISQRDIQRLVRTYLLCCYTVLYCKWIQSPCCPDIAVAVSAKRSGIMAFLAWMWRKQSPVASL